MPMLPKHMCNRPGCGELTAERYCEKHKKEIRQRCDQQRKGTYHDWYKLAVWKRLRNRVIGEEPLCRECLKKNKLTPTTTVDHIMPHKGDWRLFIDRENLQGLCKRCHDRKTVKYDGGFGNA